MSLFDIFKSAPTPAANAANPPAASAPANPAASNPTVPSAATVPVRLNADGTPAASSPLDQYSTLWQDNPNAPKPVDPFSFNADPTKLMEAARTVDFTKMLPPELSKRVAAGGADGQTAMMEALNAVAQATYAQSSLASSKIAEAAQRAAEDRFKAMIPDLLRQHSVNDNIRTTNPFANDPALAPMIEGLQTQFQRQYPQATSREISEHVDGFLNAAADRITGNRPKPVDKNVRPSMDWDAFMTGS